MDVFLLMIAVPALFFGLYLIYDFLNWRFKSHLTLARITGFQKRSSFGALLPKLEFKTHSGEDIQAPALRIDRLLYILNRPVQDSYVLVSYKASDPHKVRVAGYFRLLIGCVLVTPMIAAAGLAIGKAVLATKAAFLMILVVIALGGWVAMKLIQRSS